jgi:uncharacterized cupredoxin-like copper-binding protein
MRHIRLLTGVLVLGLTACSGTTATDNPTPPVPNAAQWITVTVGNGMSFDPPTLTVQAGQPVALTLRNTGQLLHDFLLTNGTDKPVRITANAGQDATGVFTIVQPGTYTFECSIPGHAAAGMRGSITVGERSDVHAK